jgi:hypothetical protein
MNIWCHVVRVCFVPHSHSWLQSILQNGAIEYATMIDMLAQIVVSLFIIVFTCDSSDVSQPSKLVHMQDWLQEPTFTPLGLNDISMPEREGTGARPVPKANTYAGKGTHVQQSDWRIWNVWNYTAY